MIPPNYELRCKVRDELERLRKKREDCLIDCDVENLRVLNPMIAKLEDALASGDFSSLVRAAKTETSDQATPTDGNRSGFPVMRNRSFTRQMMDRAQLA